jgi:hypothetical protein
VAVERLREVSAEDHVFEEVVVIVAIRPPLIVNYRLQ